MSTELTTTSEPKKATSFDEEASLRLTQIRTTLAALFAAAPRAISGPSDIQKAFKTNMAVSWKVFKVVEATSPFAAGAHVPGTSAMRAFLKAAGRNGVPRPLVTKVTQAFDDLNEFITAQAGERATFDSMVSQLNGGEGADQIDQTQRRAAYRANGHIFGIQAKVLLKCLIFKISDDPNMLDVVCIQGHYQLRRLRHNAHLVLSGTRFDNDDGTYRDVSRRPLDTEVKLDSAHGIALLTQFCSHPLPEIRAMTTSKGFVHVELLGNGIGNSAAITPITGWVARRVLPRYRTPDDDWARCLGAARLPCETMYFDILVEQGALGDHRPKALVYGDQFIEAAGESRLRTASEIISSNESVVHMGKGPSTLQIASMPRYEEIVRYAFDQLDWDGERFNAYRCRVHYPIVPSTLEISFGLRESPHE